MDCKLPEKEVVNLDSSDDDNDEDYQRAIMLSLKTQLEDPDSDMLKAIQLSLAQSQDSVSDSGTSSSSSGASALPLQQIIQPNVPSQKTAGGKAKKKVNKPKVQLPVKNIPNIAGSSSWNPYRSYDWDAAGPPGPDAVRRIKRDIAMLYKDPLPGIFIQPEDDNYCIVNCIVVGPWETPYAGGLFEFVVRFGHTYPMAPPRVKFLTTDAGKVRFNPNLYADGKVCLSILGTWSGPAWSPASTLGGLLLSIQTLMNETPYYNEPGYEEESSPGASEKYNQFLIHETMRVAVCGFLENVLDEGHSVANDIAEFAKKTFVDNFDKYVATCKKYKSLDGGLTKDMFGAHGNRFAFSLLLDRLKLIKQKIH